MKCEVDRYVAPAHADKSLQPAFHQLDALGRADDPDMFKR